MMETQTQAASPGEYIEKVMTKAENTMTNSINEVKKEDEPITATQELAGLIAEFSLYIVGFIILVVYLRFRNHPWIIKLNLDPSTMAKVVVFLINKNKKSIRETAVKKAKEKNVKIDVLDNNVETKTIKKIRKSMEDKLEEKINEKANSDNDCCYSDSKK